MKLIIASLVLLTIINYSHAAAAVVDLSEEFETTTISLDSTLLEDDLTSLSGEYTTEDANVEPEPLFTTTTTQLPPVTTTTTTTTTQATTRVRNTCAFANCNCNEREVVCQNEQRVPERSNDEASNNVLERVTIRNILGLVEIPERYFEDINVVQLRITGNRNLASIGEQSFAGLVDVSKLYLNKNSIQDIHEYAFDSLNLEELSLESNRISAFPDAFRFPTGLKTLNLAFNNLQNLSKDLFVGLDQLNTLSLRANRLIKLEVENTTSLESLDLRDNYLEHVSLSGATRLTTLRLDNNRLFQMPKELLGGLLQSLVSLEALSLVRNRLTSIPSVSSGLRRLDFTNNLLESLDSVARNLPSTLEELNLSNNLLLAIQNNRFSRLTNLKVLNLEMNKISLISKDAFSSLHKLERLNLKGNFLKRLPSEQIYNLVSLVNLDLSYQEYPGEKLNIVEDFSFDRNETLASERGVAIPAFNQVNLKGNPVTYFGKRAFCSEANRKAIKIEQLDLQETNVLNLNPCILKQLQSASIFFNTYFAQEQLRQAVNLNCDCKAFKHLEQNGVALKGSCLLNDEKGVTLVVAIDALNCNDKIDDRLCKEVSDYSCNDTEYRYSANSTSPNKYWYSGNDSRFKSNETFLSTDPIYQRQAQQEKERQSNATRMSFSSSTLAVLTVAIFYMFMF